jgi:hypothetical protein
LVAYSEELTGFHGHPAIAEAGFLIEHLIEPLPAETMRDRWPDHWEKLNREPGFLVLRLLKPDSATVLISGQRLESKERTGM